jgi:hypothetical protein
MGSSASANLLSWQSAFWALAPLALNGMVQPSGQICNFDSRFRFYLRTSPVICGFDFSSVVVQFFCFLFRRRSLREAILDTIDTRKLLVESDPIGAQAVEKIPTLRFIIFVFSATQAIKIFACQGIVWIQVWAFCYFAPFCCYEIFGICGTWLSEFKDEAGLHDLGLPGSVSKFNRIDEYLGHAALVAHRGLLFWLLHSFTKSIGESDEVKPYLAGLNIMVYIGLAFWCASQGISISQDFESDSTKSDKWMRGILAVLLPFIALCLTALLIMKWSMVLQVVFWIGPFEVTLFLFGWFWRYGSFVASLPLLSKRFRSELLLLSTDDYTEETEMEAVGCFFMFLTTFVLGMFWFAFRYDESGTFKPDWTNKLG